MKYQYNKNFVSGCNLFSKLSSIFIILGAISVLVGWMFNISILKSIHPSFVTMKANTAFNFLLIGVSLWFLQNERISFDKKIFYWIAQVCAGLAALIGLLTILEYLFGWNLGIDQLLFKEPLGAVGTSSPGRMAPNTAINYIIAGICLLLLDVKSQRIQRFIQGLALFGGMVSLLALIGYLYGVKSLYGPVASWTVMAVHTAVLFNLVFLTILFIRPQKGCMALISSKGLGGVSLRYVLLPIIIVLLFTGWLKVLAEQKGFFDSITGDALLTGVRIFMFVALAWFAAKILETIDEKRRTAEEGLLKNKNLEWKRTFDAVSDLIFILDKEHTLIQINKAVTDTFKCKEEDLIGKKCHEVVHKLGKPWPDCPMESLKKDIKSHSSIVDDPRVGIPLLVTVSPLLNDDGDLIGVVHIAKNISEIKNKEKKLEEAQTGLEKKVLKRTKELSQKIEELERFRKATVDRELRMNEFLKEIEQLKSEINRLKSDGG